MTISIPIPDLRKVWQMRSDEFNEWRATNDLPQLLAFFKQRLPSFAKWLKDSGISDEQFCRILPTSDALLGDEERVFINTKFHEDRFSFFGLLPLTKSEFLSRREGARANAPEYLVFEPYFSWAKKHLGRERFFLDRPNGTTKTDRPIYNSWSAFTLPTACRETMMGEFEVLKLGGVTLPDGVAIGGKNLSFADLDYLVVEGEFHGSVELRAGFSTCKHLRIQNTEVNFWELSNCAMDGFTCENSALYRFRFICCSGADQKLVDTRLWLVEFRNSTLPDLVRCELTDFAYEPPLNATAGGTASAYRRIRSAYQQVGKRQEASEAYYRERTFERRALFNPYPDVRQSPMARKTVRLPQSRFGGSLGDIWNGWERGELSDKQAREFAISLLAFHMKLWLPRYLLQTLRFKLKWTLSCIDNLVWGYGERPLRTIWCALLVVGGYAIFYHMHIGDIRRAFASNDLLDSLYFSVVTFTTVGFGDVLPMSSSMKIAAASEALLGVLLVGLSIAGFSNRCRY